MELMLAFRHSREQWSPRDTLLGRDRRIFQRVPVQMPCRMDNRLFGLEGSGTTVNLSLGGLGLLAPVEWPEGSQVKVSVEGLSLNLEGLIVFRVEVPRAGAGQYRYGVKFQKLTFRDAMHLRRILKQKYNGPLA